MCPRQFWWVAYILLFIFINRMSLHHRKNVIYLFKICHWKPHFLPLPFQWHWFDREWRTVTKCVSFSGYRTGNPGLHHAWFAYGYHGRGNGADWRCQSTIIGPGVGCDEPVCSGVAVDQYWRAKFGHRTSIRVNVHPTFLFYWAAVNLNGWPVLKNLFIYYLSLLLISNLSFSFLKLLWRRFMEIIFDWSSRLIVMADLLMLNFRGSVECFSYSKRRDHFYFLFVTLQNLLFFF